MFSAPYGNYNVCADNGNSNNSDKVTDTTTSHVATGSSDTLTVDTSKNNGHCWSSAACQRADAFSLRDGVKASAG